MYFSVILFYVLIKNYKIFLMKNTENSIHRVTVHTL